VRSESLNDQPTWAARPATVRIEWCTCRHQADAAWAAESSESLAAAVLVEAESLVVATVVASVAAVVSDVSLDVSTSLEVELEAASPAVAADALAEED
jgi:hypothetical protein